MTSVAHWPQTAEAWLDVRGRGAWIAAMVAGFIIFWPIGLALLIYMLWSKRMGACSKSMRTAPMRKASTGNSAFDAYRDETLRRLEEEQRSFEAFLERLREAKDKAEFDQFMADRRRRAEGPADETPQDT